MEYRNPLDWIFQFIFIQEAGGVVIIIFPVSCKNAHGPENARAHDTLVHVEPRINSMQPHSNEMVKVELLQTIARSRK